MGITALLKRTDEFKTAIGSRRPLAKEEVKELDNYYRVGFTYTSNALEGNSLTLTETKVLLEDGITVGGKPIKDCYEATGHAEAYDFMLSIARSERLSFSEEILLNLHKLFYYRLEAETAGIYRAHQVIITGTDYLPPTADEVVPSMKEFVSELNDKANVLHPIRLSAFAHRRFVDIHPFVDGNGRTARLLMNLILINKGYPVVSIPPVLRREYITAIEASRRSGNFKAFEVFIAECVIETQKDYCRMFHIEPPKLNKARER